MRHLGEMNALHSLVKPLSGYPGYQRCFFSLTSGEIGRRPSRVATGNRARKASGTQGTVRYSDAKNTFERESETWKDEKFVEKKRSGIYPERKETMPESDREKRRHRSRSRSRSPRKKRRSRSRSRSPRRKQRDDQPSSPVDSARSKSTSEKERILIAKTIKERKSELLIYSHSLFSPLVVVTMIDLICHAYLHGLIFHSVLYAE